MSTTDENEKDVRLGHHELVISDRYELLSITNDAMLGLWFLVGSCLFFSDSTMLIGTVLFVIGSTQMVMRPVIRLARRTHLRRLEATRRHYLRHSRDLSGARDF